MSNPGITGLDLRDLVAQQIFTDRVNRYGDCSEMYRAKIREWAGEAYSLADEFCKARTKPSMEVSSERPD